MASYSEFASALLLRDTIRQMVQEELTSRVPIPKYATVSSLDRPNRAVSLLYNGETEGVTQDVGEFLPNPGDTVRVNGDAGNRFIEGEDRFIEPVNQPMLGASWMAMVPERPSSFTQSHVIFNSLTGPFMNYRDDVEPLTLVQISQIEFQVYVPWSGRYSLDFYHTKSPDQGIATISMQHIYYGSFGHGKVYTSGLGIPPTIDLYASVSGGAFETFYNGLWLDQAEYRLSLSVASKNASSSNYRLKFSALIGTLVSLV